MRAVPLGPSVELPMGPRSAVLRGSKAGSKENAVLGGGGPMRAVPVGPSVELPMGPRSVVLGG
eukprot:4478144-Pyramimonas_sp.AAC.1